MDVGDRFKYWWHFFDAGIDVGSNVEILSQRQILPSTALVNLPLVVHKVWTTTVFIKSGKKHLKDMIQ